MVLGLYYITKPRKGAKGEGLKFYSPEEVIIALNEKAVDLHAQIQVKIKDVDHAGNEYVHMIRNDCGTCYSELVYTEEFPVHQYTDYKEIIA